MLEMLDEYSRGKVLTINSSKSDGEERERKFNFISELSILVDYEVINKFILALQKPDLAKKRPFVIKAASSLFKRIVQQTKQTWIFF
jgi:hypothetical protein